MRVVGIIQARMGSTRLSGKMMKLVDGIPLIERVLMRLSEASLLDRIIVATSTNPVNQPLVDHVKGLGYEVFEGSESDVLDRYFQAAKRHEADTIVRVTGDCPLVDPVLVDEIIQVFLKGDFDYVSNVELDRHTYPDGLDCEVFSFGTLERAAAEASDPSHREHVTTYILDSEAFKRRAVLSENDCSDQRWTVDEAEDLALVSSIYSHFSPRTDFRWTEIMDLRKTEPQLFEVNSQIRRNEGLNCSGQKLWQRAKRVIPGGNMLLSKRPEMFLPDQWPVYFSKAKGCKVWDLDGREYIDMSIMGIGTNTLGYGHPEVDEAVLNVVSAGNMSTLNCPEEVQLAERLVELHPWADMVRFARSGGEANSIAIRIARASTGKDKVAICGYHGWHDWYLSANLANDKSLDGHLLPGLEPNGVPKHLRGTVFPFNYNNFAELESIVTNHDVGVIKMEVLRSQPPEDQFLERVRQLATDRGIVLIFDECTSGFRETFGGIHKKFDVEPDMAMFGKALGNGYAITAVIGRRKVMEAAQSTFISSTFWTERIGPAAALATLDVMEKERSWETITERGLLIRKGWQDLADKYQISINHWGLPALTGFSFTHENALAFQTLLTQEMLAKGYLARNGVYVCTDHTPEVIEQFFIVLDPIFALIKECEDGRDVKSLLKGPVCHDGFKRLN